MAMTGTSVAAATMLEVTTMLAAATIFITFVLCLYLFLYTKRYRDTTPTISGGSSGAEGRFRALFVFAGPGDANYRGRGLDKAFIATMPRREVVEGTPPWNAPSTASLTAGDLSLEEACFAHPRGPPCLPRCLS